MIQALTLLWKGMLTIFIGTAAIYLTVKLLNFFCGIGKNGKGDEGVTAPTDEQTK